MQIKFSVTYVKDLIRVIIDALNIDMGSDIYNITTYPKLSISKILELASKILDKKPEYFNADTEFFSEVSTVSTQKLLPGVCKKTPF